MSLKDNLLELAGTYEQIKNEALVIVTQVRAKTKDLTDAQRLQYLLEKKDFNLKNNFLAVIDLAERHEINVSNLKKLYKKYQQTESVILTNKAKFEELGLKNMVIGPKALGALGGNNSSVYLYINTIKNGIDVKIYPDDEENGWTQTFEMFAYSLKKDIDKLLQE